MRIVTRCALVALMLAASACGQDRTAEPQTANAYPEPAPMPPEPEEPMTPAAAATEQPMTEAPPAEPATPPPPAPIKLQHGESSNEIVHVALVKDPKAKQKDKLMFFNAHVSCDEILAAKNKMLPSVVLVTDVKSDGESVELAQPMKWTYYENGKATPINAKQDAATLTITNEGGRMTGEMNITTKVKNAELSGSGPFLITTCDASESSSGAVPSSGAMPGSGTDTGTMK